WPAPLPSTTLFRSFFARRHVRIFEPHAHAREHAQRREVLLGPPHEAPRVDAAGLERDPSADQALARDARAAELDPGNAHAFALVHEESNLRARSVLGGDELARDLGEREAGFRVRIEQPTPRAIDLELGNRLTGHEASRRDEARERLF